ncbi:MAG: hypothetical protein VW405_10895 [Rhodospirillaceae bacterium]
MPPAKYLFIVAMDVDPAHEALFNEVYDNEHVPELLKVPGVVEVARLTKTPLRLGIGGEVKDVDTADKPHYMALYWIDSPDVLTSDAWGKAVETGRWPTHVRPHTSNRQHVLQKVMD